MRTSLTTPPQLVEGYFPHSAAMQTAESSGICEPFALSPLPAFECLKSLDDLDEEADEDDEDDDLDDEDEDFDEDEDEEDDLDEDYDEDDDEEDEEEDEDEDGGVKPLKM